MLDKATSNVIICCKRFYVQVLRRELDGSATYVDVSDTVTSMTDRLEKDGIVLDGEDKKHPFMYWCSQQHKSPTDPRYIAASAHCYTKPLSRILTTVLNTVYKQRQRYCSVIRENRGVNTMDHRQSYTSHSRLCQMVWLGGDF